MAKFRPYKKELEYSYALGTYPTIDLLRHIPQKVSLVAINSRALESEGVQEVLRLCKEHNVRYEMADRMIERIALKENTYCVGVFYKYETKLQVETNHVVLVGPRDMGNLGTIIRSLAGFGIQNLALIRPAADIFDPRVVRAAMGALFTLRFQYFEDFSQYQKAFPEQHLYPFILEGKHLLGDSALQFESPYSLVFGNEGQGLPEEFSTIGTGVRIPHSDLIDSLNLGMATNIALWEAYKQEQAQ